MAKAESTGGCRGCGNKKFGKHHCEMNGTWPVKRGPNVNSPIHPSNDGSWDRLLSDISKIQFNKRMT